MADVRIDEVHTEMEITDTVGGLGPAEMKKLVATVLEKLQEQREREGMRRQDDTLTNHAYTSDLKD